MCLDTEQHKYCLQCCVYQQQDFGMNKEKNLSPSQGLNLGLPNTSQMLLPLSHQDS